MSKIKQKIEWKISPGLTDYDFAIKFMEERVRQIAEGSAQELIWLVEHPPLYTAGVSAKDSDLLSNQFKVYKTNRGGKHTYHGPGMRIIYVMLDLKKVFAPNNPDVAQFVKMLENWVIAVLAELGVKGEIRKDRVGIWVKNNSNSEDKIAALGIKIKKWVSYHGIAVNINPDLSHFNGIIPCGIDQFGITSLEKLNNKISKGEFDQILNKEFYKTFQNYSALRKRGGP